MSDSRVCWNGYRYGSFDFNGIDEEIHHLENPSISSRWIHKSKTQLYYVFQTLLPVVYCLIVSGNLGITFLSLYPFSKIKITTIIHLGIIQLISIMIIWSHCACSSTDPGSLPMKVEEIDPRKISADTRNMWQEVKSEISKINKSRKLSPEETKEKDMEEVELKQVSANKSVNNDFTQDKAIPDEARNSDDLEISENTIDQRSTQNDCINGSESSRTSADKMNDESKKKLIDSFTNFCSKCKSLKPPRTHHCSQCGRCIARMDHHCPWIDNCVGIKNQKQFVLFLSYLLLGCCYGMTTLILDVFICIISKGNKYSNPFVILIAMGTLFIQFMFLVFAYLMLQDQFDSIINDTSVIDRLKRTQLHKPKEHWWVLIKNVFDNEAKIWWLLPTKIHRNVTIESQY
ncbi:unnamed protein product [Moneuplotes crassus]|uniref:Palmitoyltransferase n=1 Tax=Euplotes crassus TaxID=5936 RepID=A0AAD1UJY5_EUPCR|nr:unnamed protein product [Moneuplotes crassus]